MNLDGCYGECLVKRNNKPGSYLIKGFTVTMMLFFGFLAFYFLFTGSGALSFIMVIFVMAGFFVIGYAFPRFNVEWEYIFVDGQLDFDQVYGGLSRKRKMRIDFDQLEILAPSKSHRLDSYKNMQMKKYDFTSLTGRDNYSLICHDGNNLVRIYFEPDEEMVKLMKNKSYRKVFED